jgi:CheY-like chemotaxis protein
MAMSMTRVTDPVGPPEPERPPPICVVGETRVRGVAGMPDLLEREIGAKPVSESFTSARASLSRSENRPRCLLVDARTEQAAVFVRWARDTAHLCDTPVILLVKKPTEETFLVARQCGADDVVGIDDTAGLARRMSKLASFVPGARPPSTLGVALVAHPDNARRRHAGWILRRAGYEVVFATTPEDTVTMGIKRRPAVAAVSSDLLAEGDLTAAVSTLRSNTRLPTLPVVVLFPDKAPRPAVPFLARVALASDEKDWDHLLFQISDVTRPAVAELRATQRVFWATMVAFRQITDFEASLGLTYDVSLGGIFIRTTDAPPAGCVVNLDLRFAEIESHVISLRARVVWVHQLRPGAAGKTPAGFGTEIIVDDCPRADMGLYRTACTALAGKNPPAPRNRLRKSE